MKILSLLIPVGLLLASCNNQAEPTTKAFCDTANCKSDTLKFAGEHKLKPYVKISKNQCIGDTIEWGHDALPAARQMHMSTLLDAIVSIDKAAVNCYIKDTSYAWVSLNDCKTGRGYLMQLPFNKKQSVRKMSSAINSFDPKFVLPDDLRSYADYTTIYVEDVNTGKKEQMTFKKEYKINFNKIHETIDSVNISRNRIFVQLIENGEKVTLEKNISL